MSAETPRAAIVIPVRDDLSGLNATLESIASLETQGVDVSVVVAVDGPDDGLARAAAARGAGVVVVDPPAGSYSARNAAIARLDDDVDVVLLTDAGCVVDPRWLTAHIAALRDADLSGGAVRVTTGHRPTPAEYVDARRNLQQRTYVLDGGYAATCNLAVRRTVLDRVRFDSRLRSGGDRDFCHRAATLGFRLAYTDDAVIEHAARSSRAALESKARRVGLGVASLPDATRPATVTPARLRRDLSRRAAREGADAGLRWRAAVDFVDWRRQRAFATALRQAPTRSDAPLDVVVLLGSRWSALEHFDSRWRQVIRAWSRRADIRSIVAVDLLTWHPRRIVLPSSHHVSRQPSWLSGVESLHVSVPLPTDPSPLDRVGWAAAARGLDAALVPSHGPRLVVAATPLAAPLAARLPSERWVFDAVDDWREFAPAAPVLQRVLEGYRHATSAARVTAVSETLAARLGSDFGLQPLAVPNGVDLQAYVDPGAPPDGVPSRPFGVYTGNIEGRFDLDVIATTARLVGGGSIVVAGRVDQGIRPSLDALGIRQLGPLTPQQIPGLLSAAAVGLIPHRTHGLSTAQSPMKLFEYLAAGLRVVTTDVPGVREVSDRVTIARTAEEFAEAVARGLSEPTPTPRTDPAVLGRDWSAVAARLLDVYSPVHAVGGAR